MPSRNAIKQYVEGGYYHVYNRGVNRQAVYRQKIDYVAYTRLLESYLSAKPRADKKGFDPLDPFWRSKLKKGEVKLLAYALMPNHFHLLLKQETENGITRFMQRVSSAYTRHFKKQHSWLGSLWQGKLMAAKVESDKYLLHLSRYIHLNPLELSPTGLTGGGMFDWLERYEFSSYSAYLGAKDVRWVDKMEILSYFGSNKGRFDRVDSYKSFVESYATAPEVFLGEITLDGPVEKVDVNYGDILRAKT